MTGQHRFDGQVAVVTGGGSGLGRAHAQSLARLGATVVLNDIPSGAGASAGGAADVVDRLVRDGFTVQLDEGDIGDEGYARGLIDRTIERYGQVDVLINNAGIGRLGTAHDTTTQQLEELWRIHLMGSFWTMSTALNHMRRAGYGRVVNTSSAVAVFGGKNVFGYVVAKSAIIGMTKAAAQDNDDMDIRVNALCPLAITPMSTSWLTENSGLDQSLLRPELVSPAALYLAHPDCAVTGRVLSAGMGIWTNIFTAKAAGVPATDSVDDVFAATDAMFATDDFTILETTTDQYASANQE